MSRMPSKRAALKLNIVPVTAERMDALAALFRTGEPAGCWDMAPRTAPAEARARQRRWQQEGTPVKDGRLAQFCALLERPWAPGLLAFRDERPVGWVSVGPRSDYRWIEQSRTTPPVDDLPVWVIPCLYVHRSSRGQGIAVALLEAAVGLCRRARRAGRGGLPTRRRGCGVTCRGLLWHRAAVPQGRLRGGPATPARPPQELGPARHHAPPLLSA
jgi:GNAT superfamily N-acetyltransferase